MDQSQLSYSPAPVRNDEAAQAGAAPLRETLRDALRLALWRVPRHPHARMSGLAMAGFFGAIVVASVLAELVAADGAWRTFSPYGLNGLLASTLLVAAVILAFSHLDRSQATARRLMLVYVLMACAGLSEHLAYHWFAPDFSHARAAMAAAIPWMIVGPVTYVWLAGAARQAFKPTPSVRRPTLRAVAFLIVLVGSAILPPDWPVFAPKDFDRSSANLWEWGWAHAYAKQTAEQEAAEQGEQRAAEARAARLEAGQHLILAHAIGKLAARDPAQANVYTIGVAGWGYQDVFLKEIQQSTDILKSHFHLGDRTLNLINNETTARDAPMASVQNFGEALRAVSRRMDRDKDLLVLVLSSHGSPDGFALSYQNLIDRTLDPETLRLMLDAAEIKNRVIIVSSCYSGAFIPPLQNPDTMILTAAAADRTSFGCADDRKWTWFGEALFEKGLAERATLVDAFAAAKATIATWEREQKITASNPQIFVGDEIARKFPDIVGKPPIASLGALAPATSAAKTE